MRGALYAFRMVQGNISSKWYKNILKAIQVKVFDATMGDKLNRRYF